MPYNSNRALELLRLGTQNSAAIFREGQEEAIRHVVDGRGRLLVVQATGWGKSSVYFIATKLLREEGAGPVLLISPLLALMRNQIAAAERMGVRAFTINSENKDDWSAVEVALKRNALDILLISPECWRTNLSLPMFWDRSQHGFPCSSSTRPIASRIGDTISVPIID